MWNKKFHDQDEFSLRGYDAMEFGKCTAVCDVTSLKTELNFPCYENLKLGSKIYKSQILLLVLLFLLLSLLLLLLLLEVVVVVLAAAVLLVVVVMAVLLLVVIVVISSCSSRRGSSSLSLI
jgi:hypothetical protein